nr:HEAT repeat domain-containing protein [Desulforadius tongensis]
MVKKDNQQQKKYRLQQELEKLFIEEWGGPRSELALVYLRQNVIPRLVSCIITNHHYLENNTFLDILANKLNTEFAYPPAFAEGLSADVVNTAIKVLGRHETPQNHPWHPWEVILRMLTIGKSINDIVEKTCFSESYIEVFRKKYLNFSKAAQGEGEWSDDFARLPELGGYGSQLIRFMEDFRRRFKVFKNYYARLQAEQVIFDLELPVDAGRLLRLLEGMYHLEGRFTRGEMIRLLTEKTGRAVNQCSGMLADRDKGEVTELIDKLIENHWLVSSGGSDTKLFLAPKGARLVVPVLAPRLAGEIMEILRSNKSSRISCAAELLMGKNPEVVVHVIKQLVQQQDPVVPVLFKALFHKVSKPVLLEIIAGCGELGGNTAAELLTGALQHRDSMVRVKACQSIGKLGDRSFYFHLIGALQDKVPLVRENAVKALGMLGMQPAVSHLEKVMNNPEESPSVRHGAREAISQLKAAPEKNRQGDPLT